MTKKEITAIIIILIIAVFRFLFFSSPKPDYENFVGKNVTFEGFVYEDPDIRFNSKHLYVRLKNTKINILIFARRSEDVSYGDNVIVRGVLSSPSNFTTESGKEFNYKKYLADQDVYFIIKNPEIEVTSSSGGSFIKKTLFSFKNYFLKNINRVISTPQSDLAGGLLMGVKGGFDEDLRQSFINTGTIHIVALSGYNVSIVALNIMKVFNLVFSNVLSTILGIFSIILFIVMTGASSTAIRAGIMATIMLIGRISGRNYFAFRSLVIAGILMVAYDFRILTDMSFELSFLATAGVLLITPKVINWFKFLPMRWGIREMVSSTIGASIAVLPLLLYLTGVLSLVSLPANFMILLFIPTTMLLVFITGVLGFFSLFLSIPFGYISNLFLSYILVVIKFFDELPLSSVNIFYFPIWLLIISYIIMIWWVLKNKKVKLKQNKYESK